MTMSPDELRRFREKVAPENDDGCWLWTAATNPKGYGVMSTRQRGTTTLAHRLAYEHFVRPIPEGLCACHRCDVPACVNPAHIFLGTKGDNNRDMAQKGRHGREAISLALRGSKAPMAKLTEASVAEIKRRLRDGDRGVGVALAREYGVTVSTISSINLGRSWSHVEAA